MQSGPSSNDGSFFNTNYNLRFPSDWSMPTTIGKVAVLGGAVGFVTLSLNGLWVYQIWKLYQNDFVKQERKERTDPGSPSWGRQPEVKEEMEAIDELREHLYKGYRPSLNEEIEWEWKPSRGEPVKLKERGTRRNTVDEEDEPKGRKMKRMGSVTSDSLNMDHVYIPFSKFLKGYLYIAPFSVWKWFSGVGGLYVRKALLRYLPFLRPSPVDYDELVATLVLESMQVIQLTIVKPNDIATFTWRNLSMLDNNGESYIIDLFSVDIDLNEKRMIKATVNERKVSASAAATIIWFHTTLEGHVKLHSYANWGINPEAKDPFVADMAWATVMYNYFGINTFKRIREFWEAIGVKEYSFARNITVPIFHGIDTGISFHASVRKLAKYSRITRFILRLRTHFLDEFAKYKHTDFRGIEGEAMFIGTILHSLDHSLMEWDLEDALWLDSSDPEFGLAAEVGQFIRAGFVGDIHAWFAHKYKHSTHPFYQAVYSRAKEIDEKFADAMDAAIIK